MNLNPHSSPQPKSNSLVEYVMLARTAEQIVEDLLDRALPNGDCLECHLAPSIDRGGRERQYVQVGGRNGKKWGAPRLVLHIKNGPLTDDIWALHNCDNPKCIRPEHLFKGTAQDNTDDMITKNRKINDPDVGKRRREFTARMIKPLFEQGFNKYEIADKIGISPSTVWNYISESGPYHSSIAILTGNKNYVCVGLDLSGDVEAVSEVI